MRVYPMHHGTCSLCQRLPAGSFRYLIALIDPAGGVFPESLVGNRIRNRFFLNQTKFVKREVECTVHVLLYYGSHRQSSQFKRRVNHGDVGVGCVRRLLHGSIWKSCDASRAQAHLVMKIAPLGLAGGRSYDRTNSLRTPTMQESQLLREKTTSSVFLSTCSNAVHA